MRSLSAIDSLPESKEVALSNVGSFFDFVSADEPNRKKQLSSRLKSMAQLPCDEWDFRWIADEHEADHVGIYEAAREVLRVSAERVGCSIPDAMSMFSREVWKTPGRMQKHQDLDWVAGVFFYLAGAQFSAGIFPRAAITFRDPTLELVDATRKLRAVKVRPGSEVRICPPSMLIQVEPGVSLEEAWDALEFQFKMQRFDLNTKPAVKGRRGTPILRALSFYRYSMGRAATNLYLDFEQDLTRADVIRPGRPRTDFGGQLYRAVQGTTVNDPVNLWSSELARFEDYIADAVRQMVCVLSARL